MNNSGNTQTFKYSGYAASITFGVGTNSIASVSGSSAGQTSIAIGVSSSAIAEKDIAIGSGAVTSSGSQNTSIGTNTSAGGNNSVAIGVGSVASNSATVSIGRNSTASGNSAVVLGNSNIASGDNSFSVGEGNTASGNRATSFGWNNSASGGYALSFGRLSQASGNGAVAGGNEARANAEGAIVIGWTINQVTQGQGNTILGGDNNYITATNSKNNSLFGTSNCDITGTTGQYSAMIGGYGNDFGNVGSGTTIVGGQFNFISTSSFSSLIGSNNSILSGRTRTIGLGLSGRTPTEDNTTFTENLASFGQSYQGYFDNGSGSTFTINWNNGNTQKMSFTGAGGITCNNTQTGANYRMVINNPNGYTPTSFTAAGRTIKFNGGSFVVYSGESICELFITNDSVFVNQLGLFS
jgi:hypothetical protein